MSSVLGCFPLFACIGMCMANTGRNSCTAKHPLQACSFCMCVCVCFWGNTFLLNVILRSSLSPSLALPFSLCRILLGFLSWWKWLAMAHMGKFIRFVTIFLSSLIHAVHSFPFLSSLAQLHTEFRRNKSLALTWCQHCL